jgi:hypothetical protein
MEEKKVKQEKIRKVFLDDLPRKGMSINWIKSSDMKCKVPFIYDGTEGILQIINYNSSKQILTIKYNNKDYNIRTNEFVKCRIGILLSGNNVTKDFKIEIGTRFQDDKRDLIITDREYKKIKNGRLRKYYRYHCNKCGWNDGWMVEYNLLKSTGCSCCDNKTVVKGVNDIPTTNPEMVKYFQGGYDEAKLYTKTSNKKIYPICPCCNKIKDKPISICEIYQNNNLSCSCSDSISYPNKFSYELLNQLNKLYGFDYLEHEYSPDWIKPKRYDNYFIYKGKEYILEMDGGFHTNDNNMSRQTKEESRAIDDYKDEIANKHSIKMIRIDCDYNNDTSIRFQYIKENILNSNLNKLFYLNKIDWIECNNYALSNLVKIASEYKKNNPNITANDIGKIMGYHNGTIIRWLKQGNGMWCNYNPKEELIKSAIKSSELSKKPVEIFKDGISLGIFESGTELGRRSENLFGVKLNQVSISACCIGKQKTHKGFTFIYI